MTFPAARRLRSALVACAAALAFGLAVPHPVRAQEGAAAVQDVTLTDVVLPLGATVIKVPKLTASGTRLSRDDLAAIFKADASEPWAVRLARLDAASLTAPVLNSEHAGPGDQRQSATYRDVVARDVRGGRIGELTASGVTLSSKGTKAAPDAAGTYGAFRATDVDLASFARLALEPGDGKGPTLRVYGTMQLTDIAISDAKGTTVKVARLEGRDLGARQVPKGWNGSLDLLSRGFDDPETKRGAASATADLLGAQTVGSIDLKGVSISNSTAEPLLLEAERLFYASAGPDAGLGIEGASVSSGNTRTRLGKITLTGMNLAPVIAEMRRLADKPDTAPNAEESRRLATGMGTLTLTDLTVDLPPAPPPVQRRGSLDAPAGKQAAGGKSTARTRVAEARAPDAKAGDPLAVPAALKTNRVALRKAVFGVGPASEGAPPSTRLALTGLDVPASLAAGLPLVGALPAFGYGDLSFDMTADAAWDEAARTVALRDVTIAGKDIGTVRLAALFGGIGPELFSGSVPAQTMLLFSGNARTVDLTVENSGLFERFLAAQAKELSLKPDELRKEYVTASVLGVPVILGNGPAAKTIGAAMGQFVMNPGKLTIRAKSKEPTGIGFVELGTAGSPASVLDRLDIEAKAN
ncbi:hypothetical protein [Methylobacterium komagatae]